MVRAGARTGAYAANIKYSLGRTIRFFKKWILLFSKWTLNSSKGTVKDTF